MVRRISETHPRHTDPKEDKMTSLASISSVRTLRRFLARGLAVPGWPADAGGTPPDASGRDADSPPATSRPAGRQDAGGPVRSSLPTP